MKQATYQVYRGLAWLILAAVLVQFYLAVLAVFEGSTDEAWGPHAIIGSLLLLASLILLILAGILSGSLGRGKLGMAALLFVLLILQVVLVAVSEAAPVVGALHPVDGLLILGLSFGLACGRSLAPEEETATTRVR